jgi:glycosyltransferase involved in cell wall biosynthesis
MLGARPSGDVPSYLQHADVLVVPHVVTPFTDSLDPIKLYEYQAAGRPVVATPVAGFRDVDDDRVTVADHETFVSAVVAGVASAAQLNGPLLDSAPSADADWSRRVEQVAEVLERLRERGSTE